MMLSTGSGALIKNDDLAQRFPEVDYDFEPFGNRVFIQMRLPPLRTPGGIELSGDTLQYAYAEEQVGIVRALGSACFLFLTSGEKWPTGEAFTVGDYVRAPRHGGDNHWEGDVLFKIFKDYEIIGRHRNPTKVKTVYGQF